MLEKSGRVATSKSRAMIEGMLITKTPVEDIIREVAVKNQEAFEAVEIESYRKQYLEKGGGIISEMLGVATNCARNEAPPATDFEALAKHFSFQKTNEDLDMIYSRIRELQRDAMSHPDDDTYDVRMVKYLAQAEAIRTRVIKNQFDALRKAVLLNIGKKIASAAVSVFTPYIMAAKKDEARRRFLSAIEPLIDTEMLPKEPEDITEIKNEHENGKED